MKKIFVNLLLCFQLFSIAVIAQEKFDIVSFNTPKGWQKSAEANAVQFTKQEGNGVAIMMLFKSLPTGKDSKTTFDASWDSIVKGLLTKVDAPKMQMVSDKNGWTIESGAAIGEKDGGKLVALLLSATGSGKVVNLLILYNSEIFQTDIERFISAIDLPKVEANNPARNNQTNSVLSPVKNSNDASSIVGVWRYATQEFYDQTLYPAMGGSSTGGYYMTEYHFNKNGTFYFLDIALNSINLKYNILNYEKGTWNVSGNQLTITPLKGDSEIWSKGDSWEKFIRSENRKLEKVSYTFQFHRFDDRGAMLVMQYNKLTVRDKSYGDKTFPNAYYYLPYKSGDELIKLPKGREKIYLP